MTTPQAEPWLKTVIGAEYLEDTVWPNFCKMNGLPEAIALSSEYLPIFLSDSLQPQARRTWHARDAEIAALQAQVARLRELVADLADSLRDFERRGYMYGSAARALAQADEVIAETETYDAC